MVGKIDWSWKKLLNSMYAYLKFTEIIQKKMGIHYSNKAEINVYFVFL